MSAMAILQQLPQRNAATGRIFQCENVAAQR